MLLYIQLQTSLQKYLQDYFTVTSIPACTYSVSYICFKIFPSNIYTLIWGFNIVVYLV